MELSRWRTTNLLLPVSQVAQEGEVVCYYRKAVCAAILALSASPLYRGCHSLHISGVEWGEHKLAQTSTVAS